MSRFALSMLAVTAFAAAAPLACQSMPPNTLTKEEKAQGFHLLFDGRTGKGWRGYRKPDLPAGWQVVDGALTRVAEAGDIISDGQFANFELRLQWSIEKGGNSGIMYRVSEDFEDTYETGPEMQVLDDANNREGSNPLVSAGANYGLYPAVPGHVKPAGEWNDVRIVVNGPHVEHWLNGTRVVEYELWSDDWKAKVAGSKFNQWPRFGLNKSGHIALQDHDFRVSYRSIRIKELK